MVLVCHVIVEHHVIKALKSAITLFSKAHGMSYLHIRNFTIKVALTKIFAFVSSDSSLILVTPSCITNDEIYAKKNFCRSVQKRPQEAKKEKRKERQYQGFLPYMQKQKVHIEIINIRHIMSKSLANLFRGLLERTKCQIKGLYSGTNHSGDSDGVTCTTSNTSLHSTVTCSRLKNVLKI